MSPRPAKQSRDRPQDSTTRRQSSRRYPIQVRATFVRLARRAGSAAT